MRTRRKYANIMASARAAGSHNGYTLGFQNGRRLGRCETVIRAITKESHIRHGMSVLCITSGLGVPFAPIDKAVLEALQMQVARVGAVSALDDIVKTARDFKPDLALVLLGMRVEPETVNRLKAMGIRTAIWYSDDPYYTDMTRNTARHYDIVFTNELSCIEFYRQHGCRYVFHLPLAAHFKGFHPKPVRVSYMSDICFMGSAYWHRVEFFDQIADYLATKNVRIFGIWWKRLKSYSRLKSSIQTKWLTPEETANYYNGAKIVINLHRSPHDETFNKNSARIPAWTTNPRTFEICASGTFQLTDAREDLTGLYVPGRDLIVYSSPEELVSKIEYYLHNEEERNQIALSGLDHTVRNHDYHQRIATLLRTINELPI
ncbi:CgeB family protein [Paenibacillus prosopidis]|uniref:Spore maturation protein CgeB n=1 Tax=Paenibacillus prosopidis TaxID=630520 RepID=A0A368W5Y4_9BACL|nr:glycosyltransferase [Paenibacillus prosopidis]RCW50904.1 spore maturation protein CgeB [Paenibacillus prosopidis]